MATLTITFT